jgi:hypothetical protein
VLVDFMVTCSLIEFTIKVAPFFFVRFSNHSVATSWSDLLHTAAEYIHKNYANEGASTVIKPFPQISIT